MPQRLFLAGLLIFLAGFGLLVVRAAAQGGASMGGVVFIGPVPVVFGSGSNGWPLALVSLVIGTVMVALGLFWVRGVTKNGTE